MNNKYSNPCVRCGKERIVADTWVEQIGESTITNRQTICPDADCQKKVEKENKKLKDKHFARILINEKRATFRKSHKLSKKK